MFTLKLYQNGPLPPNGRAVIMEVAGIWIDHCDLGIKHVHAFKKKVGVQDEDGGHEFYVGGDHDTAQDSETQKLKAAMTAINFGPYGNYYGWGVLENAQGKTTEMIR